MSEKDAEFQIGDWSKPHKLTTSAVEGDHPDLAAVSCSCGWSVMTGADYAQRLGRIHLDRAFDKARARGALLCRKADGSRVMHEQKFRVTPFRREVLNRMFESARPLSIPDAMDGHPNIMPTLVRFGWAQHTPPHGYVITGKGMEAIGFEVVESECALPSGQRQPE